MRIADAGVEDRAERTDVDLAVARERIAVFAEKDLERFLLPDRIVVSPVRAPRVVVLAQRLDVEETLVPGEVYRRLPVDRRSGIHAGERRERRTVAERRCQRIRAVGPRETRDVGLRYGHSQGPSGIRSASGTGAPSTSASRIEAASAGVT